MSSCMRGRVTAMVACLLLLFLLSQLAHGIGELSELERGDISPECITHLRLYMKSPLKNSGGWLDRRGAETAAECQKLCQHYSVRSAVPVCAGWSFCADAELCAVRYHACYLSGAGYKVRSETAASGCVTHHDHVCCTVICGPLPFVAQQKCGVSAHNHG